MSSITPNQWTILEALEKGPNWIRSFHTVMPPLDKLIEQGLVERCRPHLGRGCNMVRLTEAGCAALEIDPVTVPKVRAGQAFEPKASLALGQIKDGLAWATRSVCERFILAVRAGEPPSSVVAALAEREGVQRPAIWRRLRTGGVLPSYRQGKPTGRKAAGIMRDREDRSDAPLPVDRDPCQRCGVRHDIGCHHTRAPVGMMM